MLILTLYELNIPCLQSHFLLQICKMSDSTSFIWASQYLDLHVLLKASLYQSFVCVLKETYKDIQYTRSTVIFLRLKKVSMQHFQPFHFFPLFQDSDSPRHSTASNSSTFSSPPSPSSPHKTKSLSLESTDRAGWETWWTRRWTDHKHSLWVFLSQCSSPFHTIAQQSPPISFA